MGMNKKFSKGWLETKLGIVCTKPQYGWTSSSSTEGKIKLLRTTDISHPPVRWDTVPFCEKIPEDLDKYLIQINDILVSRAGSIGLSYRINEKDKIENTVFASYLIRFKPLINPEFVEYYLLSNNYLGYISGFKSGIAVPNVNATKLCDMPFPLPPLAEQKRIATKLDAVLPRIEKLKERLNKSKELIKKFRQSVLNAAVTGKLTEEWNENEWEYVNLMDHSIKIGSGATPRGGRENYKDSGIPLIRSLNVHFEGFNEDGLAFIDEKQASKLDNVIVKENDVLLNITGASIGRVTIAPKNMDGARVNQHVCIIRPIESILSKFLSIYLSSSVMQDFIVKENYGVTRQALTKTMIENFRIPLPSLDEQHEIVKRVDELFTITDKIKKRLENLSQQIDDLGKSVLAKAFRGELVPTEADLAEKEGHCYETAEELLERIKTEKKKLEAERKKRKPSRRRKKMKERISLIEIIKKYPNGITPENLFRKSVYDENQIDKFYAELKSIESKIESIKEILKSNTWPEILIKAKKVLDENR